MGCVQCSAYCLMKVTNCRGWAMLVWAERVTATKTSGSGGGGGRQAGRRAGAAAAA